MRYRPVSPRICIGGASQIRCEGRLGQKMKLYFGGGDGASNNEPAYRAQGKSQEGPEFQH